MNVAITGISGYLGQRLTNKLEASDRIERIVGIDVVDFQYPSPKVKHCRTDIRDPKLKNVFDENEVDVVVHLAFIMNPIPDPARQRDINVNGSKNVLRAAEVSGVGKFVFDQQHDRLRGLS